jgi:hypothetical protein
LAFGLLELLPPGDLVLGFGSPVAADVDQPKAPLAEHAADQPAAMAVGRVFLAAEKGRTATIDRTEKPQDAFLELTRLGQAIVEDVSLGVVEPFALRAASQEVAEKQVVDAPASEVVLDRFLVELDRVAGIGTRTDVDHQFDPVLPGQGEERFQRVIGVPDRVDRDLLLSRLVFHRSRSCPWAWTPGLEEPP